MDVFKFGDGRRIEAKAPAGKTTEQWKRGFDAGLAAMLVVVARSGARLPVRGSTVHMLDDLHLEEAAKAARALFRGAT